MSDYLTAAETAKLVRGVLARKWPAVKWYVRSDTFSGGDSVDVYYDGLDHYEPEQHCANPGNLNRPGDWCQCGYQPRWLAVMKPDMPPIEEVKAIANQYSGAGFDGMIDLKYSVSICIDRAGNVLGTRSSGSGAYDPAWDEGDTYRVAKAIAAGEARWVNGSDWVSVSHELPWDVQAYQPHEFRPRRAGSKYCEQCGSDNQRARKAHAAGSVLVAA